MLVHRDNGKLWLGVLYDGCVLQWDLLLFTGKAHVYMGLGGVVFINHLFPINMFIVLTITGLREGRDMNYDMPLV